MIFFYVLVVLFFKQELTVHTEETQRFVPVYLSQDYFWATGGAIRFFSKQNVLFDPGDVLLLSFD